jgi:hypothetical protein
MIKNVLAYIVAHRVSEFERLAQNDVWFSKRIENQQHTERVVRGQCIF